MSKKGCRKRGSGAKKINFVATWDPVLLDFNEALGKFQHIFKDLLSFQDLACCMKMISIYLYSLDNILRSSWS